MANGEDNKGYPKILGVLGGMGPAATLDFLQKLLVHTPGEKDQDQIPTITYSNTQVPDRNVAYLENGESPGPELARSVRVLERAGVDLIAVPCNTAYIWYDDMAGASDIEVLNVPEIAAAAIPGDSKVGIISTTPVKLSGLYSSKLEARGIEAIYSSSQEEVMKAIYMVKSGRLQEAREEFLKQIRALEQEGADHILAGCTEVPVVISGEDTGLVLVDPMEELARECVRRFGKS